MRMRAVVLVAFFCVLGAAIAGAEQATCVEPTNNNVITIRFMRHGWSCAQCCRDIVLKLQLKNPKFTHPCLGYLLKRKDPRLTNIGIDLLKTKAQILSSCLPNDQWTLMSSTMTRSIETALTLFPKSKVLVVPFVKECIVIPAIGRCSPPYNPDILPEDGLSASPDAQQSMLGAVGKEISYYNEDPTFSVVKPGPNRTVQWSNAALTTAPDDFFKFLASYAKKHNKRKFMLVTHNGVMVKLLLKFGASLQLLENAETWEAKINLDGSLIKKSAKQVYKPTGTGGSCRKMTTPEFEKATPRCGW